MNDRRGSGKGSRWEVVALYVDEALLRQAEAAWGLPARARFRVFAQAAELEFIRSTQRDGRAHDITLLIWRGERFAAIVKHDYPPGAYRPPSGGLRRGESLGEGARREAREETGLKIQIARYLLRARVRFEPALGVAGRPIDWTTHVLEAHAAGGDLRPLDGREIREALWGRREELLGPVRERLLAARSAGFRYRVQLHDAIFAELDARGGPTRAPGEGSGSQ